MDNRQLSMKQNMLWNIIGSVFYQGCMWLMTVLVVRLSGGYDNSGVLAFAMSVGNIYTALGTYNMRTYQISDVNNRLSLGNYVSIRLFTVLAGLVLCAGYSFVVSTGLDMSVAVCAYLLFKADEAFVNVMYGADQKTMRLDIVGQSQILRGILCVGLFALGLVFTQNLVITFLLIFLGNIAVTLLFDIPHTKDISGGLNVGIQPKKCFEVLKNYFPSVVGLVLAGFVVSSARQYFGVTYGESALGIYASVATPCVIIQVLAQNLYAPMLVSVAKVYSAGEMRAARRKAYGLFLMVLGVAAAVSLLLALVGNPFLTTLYGPSISPYIYLLPPALVVMTEVACTALLSDLLIVFGGFRLNLLINGVAFCVNLLLVAPSTAQWYMNGINVSLIVSYCFAIILGLLFVFILLSHKKDERMIKNESVR